MLPVSVTGLPAVKVAGIPGALIVTVGLAVATNGGPPGSPVTDVGR